MARLSELVRKHVVVSAGGTTYEGTLIEVTEQEVLLKTDRGFVSVQMSKVSSINDPKAQSSNFATNRFVDDSFYNADMENS